MKEYWHGDQTTSGEIDQLSSRLGFTIGLITDHGWLKESPFMFRKDSLSVYLMHATYDGIQGRSPITIPQQIAVDLTKLGLPVPMA